MATPTELSSRPNFQRQLACVLGLPFDVLSLEQTVECIRNAANSNKRCFISTPNLNFAMAARGDKAFRDSVLRSDLSLADGMPIVWIARLFGLPLRERVSGADVFAALMAHAGPPVSVYLFGGPPGAAQAACARINLAATGVVCVGFHEPGFGSVEDMSDELHIDRINQTGAQFVLVALGAAKGQAWIVRNAGRLSAPVLCHLGAVVNFAAGTLARAPRWVRAAGFEWLWRVKEEPALRRRYSSDAASLCRLVVGLIAPAMVRRAARSSAQSNLKARIESEHLQHCTVLELGGVWTAATLQPLRDALAAAAARGGQLKIGLRNVASVDNGFVALMLLAQGHFESRGGFELLDLPAGVVDTFEMSGVRIGSAK